MPTMIMDPLYMRVRRYLVRTVQVGRAGDKIPSEKQLCEKFDVSRITVRAAIKDLLDTDVLVSRKGVGVFIKQEVPGSRADQKVIGIAMYDNRVVHVDYYASMFLAGALKKISMQGMYSIILHGFGVTGSFEDECQDLKIDGILWLNPLISVLPQMKKSGVPIVVTGNIIDSVGEGGISLEMGLNEIPKGVNYCVINLFEEGRIAADRLLDKGFDKTIIINRHCAEGDFYKGVLQAYKDHSLDSDGRVRFFSTKSFDLKFLPELYKKGFRGIYAENRMADSVYVELERTGGIPGEDYLLVRRKNYPSEIENKPGVAVIDCKWEQIAANAASGIMRKMLKKVKKTFRKNIKPTFVKN